jgi:hypothetical protein
VQVPRTFIERFAYHAVLQCRKCGARETLDQWFLFMFGRTSRCPRCGSFRVKKLLKVDSIDPLYKNPISYLQKWCGASIHWCPGCRLQFYDVRTRLPSPKSFVRLPSRAAEIAVSRDEDGRGSENGNIPRPYGSRNSSKSSEAGFRHRLYDVR